MTSSTSPALERGLDTMLLVYSLLQGHPASAPCEQFLRSRSGWFLPVSTLFESKAVLTKVYSVAAADATQKLEQVAQTALSVVPVEEAVARAALHAADSLGVDLNDAVLLQSAKAIGAGWVATDDARVAQVCPQLGLTPESPIDSALRQQIVAWEAQHLSPRGLPRILRRVHDWLTASHSQAAQDFWTQTGGASHLP
jgi:predicted nucleic acid-binding protein